jgi:hypothetical protein
MSKNDQSLTNASYKELTIMSQNDQKFDKC